MSTIFREPSPIVEKSDEIEQDINKYGHKENVEDLRPVEDDQDVLEALGVLDDIKILPDEDREDLQELKSYLGSYMEEKGLPQTIKGMRKGIENLKKDVGLDEEADPQAVIKKIGGIAKSWKALSFVRDFEERKKILIKLIGASSSKEMDKIVFETMESNTVWR